MKVKNGHQGKWTKELTKAKQENCSGVLLTQLMLVPCASVVFHLLGFLTFFPAAPCIGVRKAGLPLHAVFVIWAHRGLMA